MGRDLGHGVWGQDGGELEMGALEWFSSVDCGIRKWNIGPYSRFFPIAGSPSGILLTAKSARDALQANRKMHAVLPTFALTVPQTIMD